MLFMLLYNYVRLYPMFPIFAKRAQASESGPSADVSAAAPKRPESNPDSDVEDAPPIDSACDSFCDSPSDPPSESDHVELLTVARFAVPVVGSLTSLRPSQTSPFNPV